MIEFFSFLNRITYTAMICSLLSNVSIILRIKTLIIRLYLLILPCGLRNYIVFILMLLFWLSGEEVISSLSFNAFTFLFWIVSYLSIQYLFIWIQSVRSHIYFWLGFKVLGHIGVTLCNTSRDVIILLHLLSFSTICSLSGGTFQWF